MASEGERGREPSVPPVPEHSFYALFISECWLNICPGCWDAEVARPSLCCTKFPGWWGEIVFHTGSPGL